MFGSLKLHEKQGGSWRLFLVAQNHFDEQRSLQKQGWAWDTSNILYALLYQISFAAQK